jgi:hypothetical protein
VSVFLTEPLRNYRLSTLGIKPILHLNGDDATTRPVR